LTVSNDIHSDRIVILDFGSQYTQLIARRVREANVYSEIHAFDIAPERLRVMAPRGVVLPGSPESVNAPAGYRAPDAVFELGVPVLGICYGMQLAVLEFARTECGVEDATTEELDPDSKAILFARLRVLDGIEEMGGTMRVGAQTVRLESDSLAARIYGAEKIRERHRHRYEFVPDFEPLLRSRGMHFTGTTEDGYYEVIELSAHPWFMGVQFHPEFRSNPLRPHPLFRDFVGASLKRREAGD